MEFDLENLVQPFIISRDEERRNHGSETRVLSPLESKFDIAEKTLVKMFATQLYGDGTGNSNKNLTGLGAAVLIQASMGVLTVPSTLGGRHGQITTTAPLGI